jgi:2-C-methyl-D-erythritol 4-phosphate cytidylyltransferase
MFRNEKHIVWTIVVAAGSGTRFGGAKQFTSLGAGTVVDWAVREVGKWSDGVVVVVPPGSTLSNGQVEGGATRSESVRNGLNAVPAEATIVCVHDAARPFVTEAVFARVVDAVVGGAQGAVPGIEVADTIKVVDTAGEVVSTPIAPHFVLYRRHRRSTQKRCVMHTVAVCRAQMMPQLSRQ